MAGALALVATMLATLGLAAQANAAFTTTPCLGEKILGRGASFAQAAHGAWEAPFRNVFCGGLGPDISYDPAGSGAGLAGMKLRGPADPRFGGTDDPLKAAQKNEINAGTAAEGDEGLIHQIPIAVGAVAPLVNFPDGCDPKELPVEAQTPTQNLDGDGSDDDVVRVKFTKKQWEEIWAQNNGSEGVAGDPAPYLEWHKVFPALEGNAACKKPIVRIVRFDKSGTTFAFKDYLSRIKENRGWVTTYESGGNGNIEWPGAKVGLREDCPKVKVGEAMVFPTGPGADTSDPNSAGPDQLTSACSGNATNLVAALNKFDGSVGYADIASARAGGLAIEPEKDDNDKFWTQIPNGENEFKEPTDDEERGFRTDGQKGANCTQTEFQKVPATTLAEWGATTGVDSKLGFGICTLTYGLVFDDNADVYGVSALEEQRARSVKDYFTYIVSEGQGVLFGNDYTSLPLPIRNIAKAGVESIDWDKGEGGGGKEEDSKKEENGNKGNTTTPPVVKPSNAFSLLRKSISSKTGGATLSVKLPGAGRLELVATAKNGKKTINVARVVLNANRAGTFSVPLKASGAAKKALRAKGKLPVKLVLTFTPTGGDASKSASSLVLKLKKPKK